MGEPRFADVTVVLVHGAWADGSSWRAVIAALQQTGIAAVAVQNPTTSLAADVAATRATLDELDGPIVLVGHSWGGTVITEAGNDPKVKALVYVAAFAPDAGEASSDLLAGYPAAPAFSNIGPNKAGSLVMSREGWGKNVAQDVSADEVDVLFAVQPPLGAAAFSDKITRAAWHDRPSWYALSTQDRALDVDLQRALATKLNAHATEIAASHMSPLSAPEAIAGVIRNAATHVAEAGVAWNAPTQTIEQTEPVQ